MADYYADFCTVVKLEREAIDWAIQLNRHLNDMYHGADQKGQLPPSILAAADELMAKHGEDYCPHCIVSDAHLQEGVIIKSNDGADSEVTASYIQAILKQFCLDKCIRMDVSFGYTKHLPDAFGGAACVITRKNIEWLNIDEWAANKEAELLGELKEEEAKHAN